MNRGRLDGHGEIARRREQVDAKEGGGSGSAECDPADQSAAISHEGTFRQLTQGIVPPSTGTPFAFTARPGIGAGFEVIDAVVEFTVR